MNFKRDLVIFLLTATVVHINANNYFIELLGRSVPISPEVKNELFSAEDVVTPKRGCVATLQESPERPIFWEFPLLKKSLSCIKLASLPTPVVHLKTLGAQFGVGSLYMKSDDLTGLTDQNGTVRFGGNKLRKLEFIFGDACAHDVQSVLTFGCVGSNHAVATAACADKLRLGCYVMLKPQPNSPVVCRNLLLMDHYRAIFNHSQSNLERQQQTIELYRKLKREGKACPYPIPTGGSCPIGIIGYVNAVFELKDQIDSGVMPEPDIIYVPVGSCGTIAGILLGCKACRLKTNVRGVAVDPNEPARFKNTIRSLCESTNVMLHELDQNFPLFEWSADEIDITANYAGPGYGIATQETTDAIKKIYETEGVCLDGTYSGKAAAAMFAELKKMHGTSQVVLFWNTFCGVDEKLPLAGGYTHLPQELQWYFEKVEN